MNDFLKTNTSSSFNKHLKNLCPWENHPEYQRLTFDSGAQILEEKWNKYIGRSKHIIDKPNLDYSKKVLKSSTGNFVSHYHVSKDLPNSLPLGTQHRLNQHREWLKKFKANSDFKNSSIFF